MPTDELRWLQTRNYKNIQLENPLELHNLNVLIGPNGSGKSNLINLFHFLKQSVTETDGTRGITSFEDAVQALGNTRILDGTIQAPAAVEILMEFQAREADVVQKLEFGLLVQNEQWGVTINKESLTISTEPQEYTKLYDFHSSTRGIGEIYELSSGETMALNSVPTNELMLFALDREIHNDTVKNVRHHILNAVRHWQFYNANHMNVAEIRKTTPRIGRRDRYLSEDGTNLAAVLYNLQREDRQFIEQMSQAMESILPATHSIQPTIFGVNTFSIEWFWQDVPDPFYIHDLSDGTIRMLCWATILLSPQLPTLIVIEEPEIGIHVSWLSTLADWIKSASKKTQVVISTHSPTLLDQFTDQPENVFVFHPVDNDKVHFSISALCEERLQSWFDEGWELGDLYRIGDPAIGGWPW